MNKKDNTPPTMLVILDGFGYSPNLSGNAVAHAKMPFWTRLTQNYPHTILRAAGKDVGLLPGYIGNSEVGHLTIGSGRIIESVLKKFHDEIISGNFFENKMLINNFNKIKETGKALHIMGLLSDGGVHSHDSHLYAFLKLAKDLGLKNVFVHAILDGRDVAQKSAATYLERLEQECKKLNCGKIASISGRFYAMDRDGNWDRTKQFYDMLVGAPGQTEPAGKPNVNDTSGVSGTPKTWQTIIDQAYAAGITDEFVKPTLIEPNGFIQPGDGIVFFNFRPDRARQITESFTNPNFDKFPTINLCGKSLNFKNNELLTKTGASPIGMGDSSSLRSEVASADASTSSPRARLLNGARPAAPAEATQSEGWEPVEGCECQKISNDIAFFITTTRYDENFAKFNNDVLFEREKITNTLLDVFIQQKNPRKVFIVAETEKYAHVTYFFHGMQDHQAPNETRVLIQSIKTQNYINYPEMCANDITATVLKSLQTDPADFYLINYANADMVGHSGDLQATIKACECLDKQLEQLYNVFVEKMNGTMFITADHGNAEEKIDAVTGAPLTAHTKNPVPFIFINKKAQGKQNPSWPANPKFGISSIAPTILIFVGLDIPKEMVKEKIEF